MAHLFTFEDQRSRRALTKADLIEEVARMLPRQEATTVVELILASVVRALDNILTGSLLKIRPVILTNRLASGMLPTHPYAFEDQQELPLCCPQCASPLIDRVAREGMCDYFWFLFGRYPFRCRLCGKEFYLPHRGTGDQSL